VKYGRLRGSRRRPRQIFFSLAIQNIHGVIDSDQAQQTALIVNYRGRKGIRRLDEPGGFLLVFRGQNRLDACIDKLFHTTFRLRHHQIPQMDNSDKPAVITDNRQNIEGFHGLPLLRISAITSPTVRPGLIARNSGVIERPADSGGYASSFVIISGLRH
jgi:hypothetical protein